MTDDGIPIAPDGSCVCTCGKHYPCEDDPHEWKPQETT